MQCPAGSRRPVARYELKSRSIRTLTAGHLRVRVVPSVAADHPPSCTQESVTVPPEAGAKFAQPLLYASSERKDTYSYLRNLTEGMNGFIKDPAYEAVGDRAAAGFTEWPL
jgi:hypothetical protein